ncbi:MAG: transglutaminase N-terminal domain-containing protein [Pirellulales bacterium]
MSSLRIEHLTKYAYSRPVSFGRHRLVLRPREGHDVRVASMRLEIAPAHRLEWIRDVFGNSVAIVDFVAEAAELSIHSGVVVERSLPLPEDDGREPWRVPYPVSYDLLEASIAAAYQAATYPEELDSVKAWVGRELSIAESMDAEGVMHRLGELVHRGVKYQRRQEKGVQSPAETLSRASGSCRDMATLMMDAARSLGFAARFASGYLDCPASEAGRAAMHAWAEIYLPALGWRGYDPTLGEPTSLKHLVVGVSNHPRGVMPVSGMFTGASSDYISMTATVKIEKLPAAG